MQSIFNRLFSKRVANLAVAALAAVSIENMQFSPKALTVHKGDKVTWVNKDLVPHTVTSVDGKFDSKTIGPGAKWSYKVKQTGTLKYKCNFHPTMEATVSAQ